MLLVLHADHEQNCSTSTVRLVGSSHANMFASVSAGINALFGPLHGGANQAVLEMLEGIHASGGGVKTFIRQVKNRERGIVVSHDGVWCTRGQPFPAELLAAMDPDVLFNPTHFHRNIIPRLLEAGISQAQIDTMLVDNPRRFFSGEV